MDLTKHNGVSVLIENVGSDPYCEMSVESVEKKTIEVAAGTKAKLSFLDCPNEDVRLTASKAISKMLAVVFTEIWLWTNGELHLNFIITFVFFYYRLPEDDVVHTEPPHSAQA